jgi:hypothetical protein
MAYARHENDEARALEGELHPSTHLVASTFGLFAKTQYLSKNSIKTTNVELE